MAAVANTGPEIGTITRKFTTGDLVGLFSAKGLVAAPIHTIPQVVDYPPIRDKLLTTQTPDGKAVRLPPPSVEREHLVATSRRLPYAPAYSQDTDTILQEGGFSDTELAQLRESGIIA